MQAMGRPERIGEFEAMSNVETFKEQRRMLRWIARQPVLPWETWQPDPDEHQQDP
jgi:hypothetical protein